MTHPSPDAITLETTHSIDVTWALPASSEENPTWSCTEGGA